MSKHQLRFLQAAGFGEVYTETYGLLIILCGASNTNPALEEAHMKLFVFIVFELIVKKSLHNTRVLIFNRCIRYALIKCLKTRTRIARE